MKSCYRLRWAQQACWGLCRGNSDFRLTPDLKKSMFDCVPNVFLKAHLRSAHVHFGNPDTVIVSEGKFRVAYVKMGHFAC